MATTARPISELAVGLRDTTGAVLSSGVVSFYQPGTLVTQTVYSDAACTTAITQPLTLNAGGQYRWCYTLEPVRMIAKDSTATVTHYDDVVNLNRHDSIYVTSSGWNGGAETTLEIILGLMSTNLGAEGKWLESAGATAIAYSTVLGQLMVPVTAFGAVGDGVTDDTTAIQAASDRVEERGGGWVYFPKGTYKISSALTIDTAGVNWCGAGRGVAIIKNFGTTTNAITVNISGDSKLVFRDFSITADTTSSGAGISFTAGNQPRIERVGVALHRSGIVCASVTGANLLYPVIDSTDNNAAAVGISIGNRGRINGGEVTSSTDNGTGVVASGNDTRVTDTYVTNFATGITASGVDSEVNGGYITGSTTGITASGQDCKIRNTEVESCTTGFSLTGTRATAMGCSSRTNTTGFSLGAANTSTIGCTGVSDTTAFSVGAFASCRITGCVSTNATTDLSVNASATLLQEFGNNFTTISDSATTPHSWLKDRPKVAKVTKVTTGGTTPSFTPTPQSCDIYICDASAATGSITIAATSTTGLVDGQLLTIIINRSGGSGTVGVTWNAQYLGGDLLTAGLLDATDAVVLPFVWRAASSKWSCMMTVAAALNPVNNSGIW